MFRKRFGFLIVTAAVLCASTAEASPRWRRRPTYTTPTVTHAPERVATAYTSLTVPMSTGHTGSAQGVADMMASRGVMQHFGGNSGYEGVGMGNSPEEALNNCCYSRNGWAVVDQGVARGANGKYYACKRYGR